MKAKVGIIMGSDSDLEVMSDAAKILDEFGIPYELTIVSAHRTPKRLFDYAKSASRRGLKVIIAGAGGAAHLPGMTASISHLPVIGVPIKSKAMSGVDSLYSIVQMPPGIPVGTMAINGAKNAGIFAIEILATGDKSLERKILAYKEKMEKEVGKKALKLERIKFEAYLNENIKGN